MLKTLIIGADAVCPNYIFDHQERYPNLSKLIGRGASASYSAYVQKGYKDSYLSEMNWSSIYTGLAPWEHNIAVKGDDGKRHTPSMCQLQDLIPFWKILGDNGISVGMWAADCCVNPVEINGYVVSAHYEMIETPRDNRFSKRTLEVCDRDKNIFDLFPRDVPPRLYPRTLKQQGYSFDELKKSPSLAWEAIENYHFQDAIENFNKELDFFKIAICKTQSEKPVDVLFFYTPTTDLIAHCCMYCDDNDVLIETYRLLDRFVGELMNELVPDNIIVLSDHGMINFRELVNCADEKIAHEAFSARDEVLWLKNGYIAFEAHNGALLFTAHGLKGTFIAAGKDIKHTQIEGMRNLDIYPTLLELFNITIPNGRSGFVCDIFNKNIVNEGKLLCNNSTHQSKVAVLQSYSPSITDIVLNELYLHKRFATYTVVGEEKYKEIYLHNPRVNEFINYKDFNHNNFDAVYYGVYNETSGLIGHILVHGRETE